MSLIPAKPSGLKLSSWLFDGRVPKDCGYAPIKVVGTGTCCSWISISTKDQEQICISDQCGGGACRIVSKIITRWLPPSGVADAVGGCSALLARTKWGRIEHVVPAPIPQSAVVPLAWGVEQPMLSLPALSSEPHSRGLAGPRRLIRTQKQVVWSALGLHRLA